MVGYFLSVGALNHKIYIFLFKVVAEEIINKIHICMDMNSAGAPHNTQGQFHQLQRGWTALVPAGVLAHPHAPDNLL